MDKKLWGGRFEGATNAQAAGFHSSISFDSRLYKFDILGSIAHAKMLGETGIIEQEAAQEIVRGLQAILVDIESGKVAFDENDEDIHMNIERVLTERIGENGKKLHTGRSRNDQVALDTRMFVKQASADMTVMVKALMSALIDIAQVNLGIHAVCQNRERRLTVAIDLA